MLMTMVLGSVSYQCCYKRIVLTSCSGVLRRLGSRDNLFYILSIKEKGKVMNKSSVHTILVLVGSCIPELQTSEMDWPVFIIGQASEHI